MDVDAGSIVYAIAGRDKGGVFVVVGLAGTYCYLADGKSRKADHPKKKKWKHIKASGQVAESLKEKIALGERPTNSEIRRAIAAFCELEKQSS